MFLPHPRVKLSIVGSLRDREVACSASDRQGTNFESCVWRTVSSYSSHHPQEFLLAQFSLCVHKDGLKPDSFHFHLHQPRTSHGYNLCILGMFTMSCKDVKYVNWPNLGVLYLHVLKSETRWESDIKRRFPDDIVVKLATYLTI